MPILRALSAAVLMYAAIVPAFAAEPAKQAEAGKVSYYREVRPILQQNCQGCHQPAKAQGGYLMLERADLLNEGDQGKPGVVPGDPAKSFLIQVITPNAEGKAEMPKGHDSLNPIQRKILSDWIAQGATDDTPASARARTVDPEHPPVYQAAPVVTALVFSPDGKLLAVSGYHEVLLFNGDGSKLVARLVGLSERVQSLAFSPDGKSLAVAGGAPGRFGEVQIWDVAKRKLKMSAPETFDTIYGVSWSPDGTKVAFGCADNTVRAIDPATGKQVLQMGTHSDWVLGTVFSKDGLHLASVSRDMTMKLTEVATQRFVDNVTSITPGALKGGLSAVAVRSSKEKKIQVVPPDAPGEKPNVYEELLVAGSDGVPRLYMMHREKKRVIGDDFNRLKEFEKMPGRIYGAQFNADGNRFAAASSLNGKGEVRVYDAATGKFVPCEKVSGPAYAVAWRPDGKVLASSGFDGIVWLNDPDSGKLVRSFVARPDEKTKVAASAK